MHNSDSPFFIRIAAKPIVVSSDTLGLVVYNTAQSPVWERNLSSVFESWVALGKGLDFRIISFSANKVKAKGVVRWLGGSRYLAPELNP